MADLNAQIEGAEKKLREMKRRRSELRVKRSAMVGRVALEIFGNDLADYKGDELYVELGKRAVALQEVPVRVKRRVGRPRKVQPEAQVTSADEG